MMKQKFNKDEIATNIEMSIQVSLNGLSFCMLDIGKNEIFYFKKTQFKKRLNPTEVLQQIKLLYAKEASLQKQVGKVNVIFENDLYTLVPHIFFKEEQAPDYLKYNAKILQTDFVSHDIISRPQIVNIYIPYANISNYFFDLYGEFEYKHAVSIFLEGILDFENTAGRKMYVNIGKENFALAVVEDGKLLLCNSFYFQTKEDFIYYILFTAEQLKLDPQDFELLLMGEIEKESELYNIAYTYVRNVVLYQEKIDFEFTSPQKPAHLGEEFVLMKSMLHENSIRNT